MPERMTDEDREILRLVADHGTERAVPLELDGLRHERVMTALARQALDTAAVVKGARDA